MQTTTPSFEQLLGTEFGMKIAEMFGIEGVEKEEQAELLELVGVQVMEKVMLEILTALPEAEHEHFEKFVGSQDSKGLDQFLRTHIPDYDSFVAETAAKELEAIRAQAANGKAEG